MNDLIWLIIMIWLIGIYFMDNSNRKRRVKNV